MIPERQNCLIFDGISAKHTHIQTHLTHFTRCLLPFSIIFVAVAQMHKSAQWISVLFLTHLSMSIAYIYIHILLIFDSAMQIELDRIEVGGRCVTRVQTMPNDYVQIWFYIHPM